MRSLVGAGATLLAGCFPVFGDYEASPEGTGGAGAGGAGGGGGAPPGLSIAWQTTLEAQRPPGSEVEPALHLHGLAASETELVVVGAVRGAIGAVAAPSERPLIGHVGPSGLERSRVYDVTGSTDRRGGALHGAALTSAGVRAAGTFHGALSTEAGDVLHGESGSWFVVELDAALETAASASECAEAACAPPSTAGIAVTAGAVLTTRMVPGDPTALEQLAVVHLDEAGAASATTVLTRFPCESPNALGLEAAPPAALLVEGERAVVVGSTCTAPEAPRAFVDLVGPEGARASLEAAGDAASSARAAAWTTEGVVLAGDFRGGALAIADVEARAASSRSTGFVAWVTTGDDTLSAVRVATLEGRGEVFVTSVVAHQGRVYVAGSTEGGGLNALPERAVGRGREAFVVALSHEGEVLDALAFGDFEAAARTADRAVVLATGGARLAAAGPFRGALAPGQPETAAQASFVLELDPGTSASR